MIELNDIVEAASADLKDGTLVLHRSMRVHPQFKVYKKFCYNLYRVNGKDKELIYAYEETKNTPADDIMKIWNECDKSYLKWFLKWIAGNEYKAMLKDGV